MNNSQIITVVTYQVWSNGSEKATRRFFIDGQVRNNSEALKEIKERESSTFARLYFGILDISTYQKLPVS